MDKSDIQPREAQKKRGVSRIIKEAIFGENPPTEEQLMGAAPKDIVPDRSALMKKVLVKARRLFDVFKFTLIYKKRSSSGLQFYGMRKYTPQDDASKIDWKTSVRMSAGHEKVDELYLKEYEEELDLATFIILDTSNTMLFGTRGQLKSDQAATVAATLCYAASVAKTRFGLEIFNTKIRSFHMPSRGDMQFHRIIDAICDHNNYSGKCNLGMAIKYAQQSLERRTLLIIISDFIDIGDDWYEPLKQASAMFDSIIGVMVRDRMDRDIPPGLGRVRVSAPFDRDSTEVDLDRVREKFNEEAKKEEAELKKKFNQVGAGFINIDTTDDDFVKPFLEYFTLWASGR